MTDLRARLADALWEHYGDRSLCEQVADVLLSLPGITIVDRDTLAQAIADGIRSYAGGEGDAYSYHGDGSALEAMHRIDREADDIARYIFTHDALSETKAAERSAS